MNPSKSKRCGVLDLGSSVERFESKQATCILEVLHFDRPFRCVS